MIKHVKVDHENLRYACFLCAEVFKSVFALQKHLKNPTIHDFQKKFDPVMTKVKIQEDMDYKHTDEAKNKLISELKRQKDELGQMTQKLRSENKQLLEETLAKMLKYENENKTLKQELAKALAALETSKKEKNDLEAKLEKFSSPPTRGRGRGRGSQKKKN